MALAPLPSSSASARDPSVPPAGMQDEERRVPVAEAEQALGRYLLRYEIASGGMASVYLARVRGPAGFERPVAIKRIHPHLARKRDFVDMFLDEARLSARISHPNVCSVFDFGEVEGAYFMAMEYLVGQPVSAMLRVLARRPDLAGTPRWRAIALRIVADACEGMHSAHELRDERGVSLGVVHRDFTPQNLFVTYDGGVKVLDFGIARAEGRLHQTETGTLKGKIAYMAPEQVRGEPYDRRLDVWAAGVCLWEMLTVQRLFGRRSEVELLQAVLSEEIPAPSAVRPGISPELDAIVLRALERDPAARTPTARALATELHRALAFAGVSASLADTSELMKELFASERASELGVVADVLTPMGATDRGEMGESTEPSARPPAPPAPPPRAPHDDAPARAGTFALPGAPAPTEPPRTGPSLGVVALALGLALAAVGGLAYERERRARAEREAERAISDVRPVVPSAPVPSAPASPPPGPAADGEALPTRGPRAGGPNGTLSVSVRGGWADVYVDGERVGRAPRRVSLPAGEHLVELRPEGRLPAERRTVQLRAGETERVAVDVGRAPAAPHRHWPGVGLTGPRPPGVR